MDDETANSNRHGIWLAAVGAIELALVLGAFAKGAYRLLVALGLMAYGFQPMLLVALVVALLYLAAALAPLVGLFARHKPLRTRVALVLAPFFVFGAAYVAAVAIHVPGVVTEPPPPPPAGCRPSTLDPALRLRPCNPFAGDAGLTFEGDCPEGFICREPIGQHGPPVCFMACYHDCGCPEPSTCVNAACRFPGDPLP